jgi:predicted DNA-binding transcriptional regulator AlpA
VTIKPAYLDMPGACIFIALSEYEILKLIEQGDFPKPRAVSARCVRWLVSDLEAWAEARTVASEEAFEGSKAFHLYRHFDAGGTLLYVGVSISALNRLMGHKEKAHWYWTIARMDVTNYETRQASLDAERKAIIEEMPLFNIANNKQVTA